MIRSPVPLIAAALLLAPGCASDERHPGVRLRRSDSLYAREDYGDPARRRQRDADQPFRSIGGKLQRFFTGRDTISR